MCHWNCQVLLVIAPMQNLVRLQFLQVFFKSLLLAVSNELVPAVAFSYLKLPRHAVTHLCLKFVQIQSLLSGQVTVSLQAMGISMCVDEAPHSSQLIDLVSFMWASIFFKIPRQYVLLFADDQWLSTAV